MSAFYSSISYLSRFFQKIFRKSLLFSIIFSIGRFIENQWVNSYFKSLYPGKDFLSILKQNNIFKNHIFAPLVVIFVFTIFLLLSFNPVSNDLILNIAIGFLGFLVGSMIIPSYFFKSNQNNFIKFNKDDIYSIGFCLVLIGVIFFFLSIASVGGIPLLKPSLRYLLKPILTMPVFLMIPGIGLMFSAYLDDFKEKIISRSQIRFRFLFLTSLISFLLFALGYRTPIIAILLIAIIMGYYGKILEVWEVILGALSGVGLIIGIGYFRSLGELTISSSTNPFYSLQSRADFTLHVLNLLNQIAGSAQGEVILNTIPGSELGPRMTIGKLIAWRTEVTVTPTLIGQMIADFGKLGVAIGMGFLGFILGMGYKLLKLTKDSLYIAVYAIILTYTILGVETGILDIQVIFYFILGFLLYLANILRNMHKN
ncbi:MAG: oligosaccharide repeat unit polymerase family protein [Methanobrevibacter sp.]|jgi:oligosaccharide repeat unit polymerase|nr:oligosaccharide repeat unit polymerase family protein [Methanobrevibacter sp.]